MSAIGIIPARFASVRFHGKLLVQILGKTLIQRTYENAARCKDLSKVIVATDHTEIFNIVKNFGGEVVMTSVDCPNGTERICEALKSNPELLKHEIIVNIQGDEPCIKPAVISKLVERLKNSDIQVATPITKIINEDDLFNPSVVKCVKTIDNKALYFSRSTIPHPAKHGTDSSITYFRHIGIYAFRKDFLFKFVTWPSTPLQRVENLEQLKILENGYSIAVLIAESAGIDVNEPNDIQKLENYLCQQNLSL